MLRFLSDFSHMLTQTAACIPWKPQQAPFAPARAMLTEKTHLPRIVEIFINSNLCHSDRASEENENIWA